MMKKLLLLSSAVFTFYFGANSQNAKGGPVTASVYGENVVQVSEGAAKSASNPTVVTDVLHYYLNKYYFKTAESDYSKYPYYKSACATVTNVSHCGSRFDVPAGETVTVTGLEAYASKHPSGANQKIEVHIFLCNLDANNKPILPPVDSIVTWVGAGSVQTPSLIGGNFTHTTSSSPTIPVLTPHTMTTSFAVLFRNMSTVSGDTVHLLRTNGAINSNWMAAPTDRCSDGDYGYVRFLGGFYSSKEFTLAPGFGMGTDYEFMVAPRVTYTAQASQLIPQGVLSGTDQVTVPDTLCTRTELTFTNTSSGFFEHRMYNLNQFYRKWNLYDPFHPSVQGSFSSDSSITWHFEFYDGFGTHTDSRVFLPYVNNHTIMAVTDAVVYPNCFTDNEFRARLKPMGALGTVPQLVFNDKFKVCFKYCNGDALGISTLNQGDAISVYPNPAISGKTTISGLTGKNTVAVYNMLGQVIVSETTENASLTLDLTKHPKGTYVVRIMDEHNQSKTVKVINQN